MSITIAAIEGESILDSRGVPTLSVTVRGSDGSLGNFSVPSGASTGIHEAYELRDDGASHGGVNRALGLLHAEISDALVGMDLYDQQGIDDKLRTLDGTPNKMRLGGNTLIGVSIAVAKAAAAAEGSELWKFLHLKYFQDRETAFPRLYANLINGGKHAETKLAFQEYHIVPKSTVPHEALTLISRIQESLYQLCLDRFGVVSIGDEGGYALPLTDVEEPLKILLEVVTSLGVRDEVDFALDVAASSFFEQVADGYRVGGDIFTKDHMTELYQSFTKEYPLLSIEDPFHEEDFISFSELKKHIGTTLRVGDDLTTTSRDRLLQALENKSVDALIIKPNQIGTLTETIETMKSAHENGVACIVSHRSGETLDSFIADLAYASSAFGIKAGARGPEAREAKYDRLLAIESSL